MDKGTPSSLFVNDGSFLERFKQLQQDKGKERDRERGSALVEDSKPIKIVSGTSTPSVSIKKPVVDTRKTAPTASGGRLAFSLKQKTKLAAPPVKLGADEDEDEADAEIHAGDAPVKRQKLGDSESSKQSSGQTAVGNNCFHLHILLIWFTFMEGFFGAFVIWICCKKYPWFR